MSTLTGQIRPLVDRARPQLGRTTTQLAAVVGQVRPVVTSVTPLGWGVIILFLAGWIFGAALGWQELLVLSGACLLVLVIAVVFVVGPHTIVVSVELDTRRVTAGDSSAGAVRFSNRRSRRSLPMLVELPVGADLLTFDVPALKPGEKTEELFVVQTERRGIIEVGPATVVRRDPVGVLARKAIGNEAIELIVHPHITPLEPIGAGILRDLEGYTTNEISQSDLAFHSMREYTPGDDPRQVHWRSTAKTGILHVRQYLDTRRASLLVVVDTRRSHYADPGEFEIALEVAGSLTACAARNDVRSILTVGRKGNTGVVVHEFLDVLARAELEDDGTPLPDAVARAAGADTTLGLLVSGSLVSPTVFYRAAARLSPETQVTAIKVVPGVGASLASADRLVVAQLGETRDLRAITKVRSA